MPNEQKPEEPKKPINLWELVEFPEGSEVEYATGHFVQHTNREILIVFNKLNPPNQKAQGISKIILNPAHAYELVHNIQSQLAHLKKSLENPPEEGPPKRP